jgi:hypothetical protein
MTLTLIFLVSSLVEFVVNHSAYRSSILIFQNLKYTESFKFLEHVTSSRPRRFSCGDSRF